MVVVAFPFSPSESAPLPKDRAFRYLSSKVTVNSPNLPFIMRFGDTEYLMCNYRCNER